MILRDYNGLIIYDQYGVRIDTTKNEFPEQTLVKTYLSPYATVLELGARFGSVSCTINNKLYDKTKQVSVEPDYRVWDVLDSNILMNKCTVYVYKGFVSKHSHSLIKSDTNERAYGTKSGPSDYAGIPSISVEDLQSQNRLVFDTLVADCEGFLETFFDEHPFMYNQLHTIIFEADSPDTCNYDKIRASLKASGFREIVSGFQNVYMK